MLTLGWKMVLCFLHCTLKTWGCMKILLLARSRHRLHKKPADALSLTIKSLLETGMYMVLTEDSFG